MKDMCVRWMASAGVVCVLAGGCAPKPPPPATRPAKQASLDAASVTALRVRELSRLSDEYASLSHQLPGNSREEHRQLMCSVFDKLDEILPLLIDPHSDLVFQQHIVVLEDARSELGGNPPEQTIAPTIDTGLRSAYNALAQAAAGKDFDQSEFTAPLADMKARLDELDAVRGPTHQVIVAEAVGASSAIISKLADSLSQRLAAGPPAATEPAAVPPVEPPATAPATAPATQPR